MMGAWAVAEAQRSGWIQKVDRVALTGLGRGEKLKSHSFIQYLLGTCCVPVCIVHWELMVGVIG